MFGNLCRLVSPRRQPLDVLCLTVVLWSTNALAQITYTVGPPSAGACGGSDCDYQSIQSAIDVAAAGDTVTAYRRTDDSANNECYNEHITINKANLTVQGASTTPSSSCPTTCTSAPATTAS